MFEFPIEIGLQVERALRRKLPLHKMKYLNSEPALPPSPLKQLMIAMYVMKNHQYMVLETP